MCITFKKQVNNERGERMRKGLNPEVFFKITDFPPDGNVVENIADGYCPSLLKLSSNIAATCMYAYSEF